MADQLALFLVPRCIEPSEEWSRCCGDCLFDVFAGNEYFIVRDDVWPLASDGGKLCVGCLESRIGRRLTPDDFTDCEVNRWRASERLSARMGEGSE